jgi:RNA polymerase primary sigma factor
MVQDLGREPTPGEIAERLGVSEEEVLDTLEINTSQVSLNDPFSDEADDNTYIDYLEDTDTPSPDTGLYADTLRGDMVKALDTLPERERIILTLYYGIGGADPLTLEQIGDRLGYTRERIRQLKVQALERIRSTGRADYLSAYAQN